MTRISMHGHLTPTFLGLWREEKEGMKRGSGRGEDKIQGQDVLFKEGHSKSDLEGPTCQSLHRLLYHQLGTKLSMHEPEGNHGRSKQEHNFKCHY